VVTARNVLPFGDVLFYTPHDKASRVSKKELQTSDKFKNLKQGLLRIQSLADSYQAKVLVVIIPPKEEVYSWMLHEKRPWELSGPSSGIAEELGSWCEENHLQYLDLTPHLVSEAKSELNRGEMLWWRDDSHWNPEGHRVTARIVKETLNQR
jgi:lysophospholipase L1-like esterase